MGDGGDPGLSLPARHAIDDAGNAIFVSAASAWEIATKVRIGKLSGAADIAVDLAAVLVSQLFTVHPISSVQDQATGALPGSHKDPFDRMLIAQGMLDGMVLVSNETQFDAYGVRRLW